jgi:hypothetical protein
MKQLILNIPDHKYTAFINLIKSKFSDIQIKSTYNQTSEVQEKEGVYEISLLSEKSLEEDWLSEEDERWDEVL